jgi:hypothetical protein
MHTPRSQRTSRLAVALLGALVASVAVAGAHAASTAASPSQLKSTFKKATAQTLVVDKLRSSPGSYTAFNLGVQTGTKQARYGTFTIYLVTNADVEGQVTRLLTDPHTGQLGTPGAGGIHWEKGRTMTGTEIWMAKKRYGSNVVLWWTTTTPVRKTDRTFTTLHKALLPLTKT